QPHAHPSRPLAVLTPGDAAPDAEVLLAHRDPVPALADHVAEEAGQGVLAVHGGPGGAGRAGDATGLGAQRHVFFLFQRRVPRTLDSLRPRKNSRMSSFCSSRSQVSSMTMRPSSST